MTIHLEGLADAQYAPWDYKAVLMNSVPRWLGPSHLPCRVQFLADGQDAHATIDRDTSVIAKELLVKKSAKGDLFVCHSHESTCCYFVHSGGSLHKVGHDCQAQLLIRRARDVIDD